jgi:coenzyme F420-reducing hydrogenase delta subunit
MPEVEVAVATEKSDGFEPELTLFTCNYCAYMAGDTAGSLRVQYPANVKMVRLPCTGKIDVRYIMSAFEQGADGVYVVACPIGSCHHVRGNERARARINSAKKLLDQIGLGSERLEIFFISAGQGTTYAAKAKEMVERVKKLGPNPLRKQA